MADEPVLHAVAESIDEIGRDSNARRAVVRAYARMERALDDAGLPRRPHEAPFEFVERALQRLHVSAAAAGRLAGLFELAHFSRHDIDDAMKRDAVRALRLVQQELEAGT